MLYSAITDARNIVMEREIVTYGTLTGTWFG